MTGDYFFATPCRCKAEAVPAAKLSQPLAIQLVMGFMTCNAMLQTCL